MVALELFHGRSRPDEQLDTWGMGPRWTAMGHASTSSIDVGTLVLTFYDLAAQRLVWRGSVSKTLNPKQDPDKNYKNLEKAVEKVLRDFPPQSRK